MKEYASDKSRIQCLTSRTSRPVQLLVSNILKDKDLHRVIPCKEFFYVLTSDEKLIKNTDFCLLGDT